MTVNWNGSKPKNAGLTWEVDNPGIATISAKGVLTINDIRNAGDTKKTYAEYKKYTDTGVSYQSSNPSVATVNKSGKISIKKGTSGKSVTIYAASADGKQVVEILVTVK